VADTVTIQKIPDVTLAEALELRLPRWTFQHPGQRTDTVRSAQNAADQTGIPQYLFGPSQVCSEQVIPDDIRYQALQGVTYGPAPIPPQVVFHTGRELQAPRAADAGLDLPASSDTRIEARQWANVACKIRAELPAGYWGLILGRSSTFYRRHMLVNQAVIDNGYRGELFVSVHNLSDEAVLVKAGEALAQLILVPLVQIQPVAISDAEFRDDTARGASGFGSTGLDARKDYNQLALIPEGDPEVDGPVVVVPTNGDLP
jgi:dUTP pyrophosphatase